MIRLCLAGATGWAGSALARAVVTSDDVQLTAGVSRRHAGRRLGEALAGVESDAPLFATADEALALPCDVFVEYTSAATAKGNIMAALAHGAHVVVGSSGVSDEDYAEIAAVAARAERAVLACGNFALTVVLLQRFALQAAKLIPQWEVIDYASDKKVDAPSGTARELAARLAGVGAPRPTVAIDATVGARDARGATLAGTQVHSLRLPSFAISAEVIFGMPGQRLSLRHDSGESAVPYVDGALLAVRRVSRLTGLHRGLESVLDLE